MKAKLASLITLAVLMAVFLLLAPRAQAALIFSDNFSTGSTLNSETPAAPTATSAAYQLVSSKAWSPAPTLGANDLRFGIAANTNDFIEVQARFANAPLSLMFSNDFIEFTVVFTNTSGLFTQAGHVGFGLYNSGGVSPLASGLNGSATNGTPAATGGAQRWRGYVARIAYNGGNHRLATRPAQSINCQDLLTEGSASQSYTNGVNLVTNASTFTRTAGSLLTEVFRLTRTNTSTLKIESRLYLGGNTNGTLLVSQTATATGANFLNSSFDSLAVGWRTTTNTSATLMEIKSVAVNYVGPSPLPIITLNGGAALTNECHAAFTDSGATAIGVPLAIAGGFDHSLALKSDGKVVAWGWNGDGQTNIPVGLSNVSAIAGGRSHTLALKSDGKVAAWGDNTYGQTNIPVGLSNVVAIAAGGYHNLALKSDGKIAAWGEAGHGQTNIPTGLSNVVAVAGGDTHSLALKSDGTVAAWGDYFTGSTFAPMFVPVGLSNVVAIAGGGSHSLALKSDGTVVAWGYNAYGQTNNPVGLSNVVAIAGGFQHSLALKGDGTVVGWGRNNNGQTNIPVGLNNVVSIAGGSYHSLALKSDGTVVAWGNSFLGQTNVPVGLSIPLPLTVSGSVDTNTPGSYLLTYNATNSFGGIGAIRTVVVRDTLPPVITLLGASPLTYTMNLPFVDPGATALDVCGGSIAVMTNSTVNIAFPGTYSIRYTATDSSGNSATNSRWVRVVMPPLITLNGSAVVTNECHAVFTDPGATATGGPLAIAVGYAHNLLLKSDGKVAAWGYNAQGQTNTPAGLSNVVAIAGGGFHNLALKSDGTVVAWGNNGSGQTNNSVGLSNVVAIAGGLNHSLALKRDGNVIAWGDNGYGQTNIPVGLSNVVAIAGGDDHSLALRSDGTVVAWGLNNAGQANIPVGLSNVTAIAGGTFHILALMIDGKVVAWGNNPYGQTNIPVGLSNVVSVTGGSLHSLALKNDGTVVAWGRNDYGQTNIPVGLSNVVAIAAGDFHNLALKRDGTVVAWGDNTYGQTNIPTGLSILLPVAVSGGVDTNTPGNYLFTYTATNILGGIATATRTVVVQDTLPPVVTVLDANPLTHTMNLPFVDPGATALDICGGSLAVTTNSTVNIAVPGTYAVTYTATDSSGNAATATRWVQVVMPPAITLNGGALVTNECHAAFTDPGATATGAPLALAAGYQHSLALKSDGTVALWGNDDYGQTTIPFELSSVVGIASGGFYSLALKNDGTVVAWGVNNYGQTNIPMGLSNVVAIAGGTYHSLALKSDGTVVAWGYNDFGQTNIPVGLTNVVAIAGGGLHSLALKSDGTVVAWGSNGSGQTNIPAGLSNVVAIAAGGSHNLALKSDGTVIAWGRNDSGQTNIPVGLSNVAAIAAGDSHNLALKSDGTVVAWGDYHFGKTNIPAGLTNVVGITGGRDHSLALKSDGIVVAWGHNGYGQTDIPGGLSISLPFAVIGSVDTNTPGSYLLTYTATNSLGGIATTTRTVVVQDTLPPAITLLGANPLTLMLNDPFVDPGATALDICGGSIAVATNSTVNIAVPGTYAVTYTATDSYGNTATNTRVVQVGAPLPVITSQPTGMTLACGTGPASFNVTATGEEPLAYQWHFNGALIPGATASNHMVNPATPANVGGYTVVITNFHGAVTSSVAVLTLTNQTPTAIAGDAFSMSPGGTLLISPSALMGNDSAGACDGSSTELTFLSFSLTSVNGGTLETLPGGQPLWTKRYNGPGDNHDVARAIALDGSGNVYVTGSSGGSVDYATVAYSSAGLALWTNRYDGPGNSSDEANAVAVDESGNVYVTGASIGSGSSADYATVAYSGAGVPLWTNRYNGSANQSDYAYAVVVGGGGNVYVAGMSWGGSSGWDYATVAYLDTGLVLWTNRYSGPSSGWDIAHAAAVDESGNVYVTGYSIGSGGYADYATVAYSGAGVPLWTNRYNGPGNEDDVPKAVAVDGGGNVYVTGSSYSNSLAAYATVAYSSSGLALWTNLFNGPGEGDDLAMAMAVDTSGNVHVTGSSGGSADYVTVAYSSTGLALWTNRYNGPGNEYDEARAVAVDDSGNVFVTGVSYSGSSSDYATVAYSGAGVPLWTNIYNGPDNLADEANVVAVDGVGNVYVTGASRGSGTFDDYLTIAYSSGQLVYTPTNGFTGVDTFTYVMLDGYGLMHTGTVSVAVGVVANTISTAVLPGGEVQLGFYGTPGQPYALERIFDLTSNVWSPQQTNTATASGALAFTNLPAGSANFWRIRSVP